jgi:hypothetical protein
VTAVTFKPHFTMCHSQTWSDSTRLGALRSSWFSPPTRRRGSLAQVSALLRHRLTSHGASLWLSLWGYTAATCDRLVQDPMRSPSIIYVAVPLHPNSNHARVSQVAQLVTCPLVLLVEQTSPVSWRVISPRTPPLVRLRFRLELCRRPFGFPVTQDTLPSAPPGMRTLLRLQSPSTSLGTGET